MLLLEIDGHKCGVFLDAGICVKCDEDWPCSYVISQHEYERTEPCKQNYGA